MLPRGRRGEYFTAVICIVSPFPPVLPEQSQSADFNLKTAADKPLRRQLSSPTRLCLSRGRLQLRSRHSRGSPIQQLLSSPTRSCSHLSIPFAKHKPQQSPSPRSFEEQEELLRCRSHQRAFWSHPRRVIMHQGLLSRSTRSPGETTSLDPSHSTKR